MTWSKILVLLEDRSQTDKTWSWFWFWSYKFGSSEQPSVAERQQTSLLAVILPHRGSEDIQHCSFMAMTALVISYTDVRPRCVVLVNW